MKSLFSNFQKYLYIEVEDFKLLEEILQEEGVGETSLVLEFSDKLLQQVHPQEIIAKIKKVLVQKDINPLFPYPIYLMGDLFANEEIPYLISQKDIPNYFQERNHKSGKRENELLKKIDYYKQKLRCLNISVTLKKIPDIKVPQREFSQFLKECHYYSMLNKKISLQKKEEEPVEKAPRKSRYYRFGQKK